MSSLFAPNTQAFINGGTFTQVFTNDEHYHRFQGAFVRSQFSFVKLIDSLNRQRVQKYFTGQQPLLRFTTQMNGSIPPNVTRTHAWPS